MRCAPNDTTLIVTSRSGQTTASSSAKCVQFTFENINSWRQLVETYQPDSIINAIAMTDVDLCETEVQQAFFLNCEVVQWMVDTGLPVVHLSTDYVFDGKQGPYLEQDVTQPLGVYGQTKLESEQYCLQSPNANPNNLVLRTMNLWGVRQGGRPSFVDFVQDRLEQGQRVTAATDQVGNPTLAEDVALAIWKLLEKGSCGLFHVSGSDAISRYEWAIEIARHYGLNQELIQPCLTEDLSQVANRPLKSGFLTDKLQAELSWKPRGLKQQLLSIGVSKY
jgi:dTDP-4-dehydrorhamnose reductase